MVWVQSLRSLGTNYVVAAAGFYALWAAESFVIAPIAVKIDHLPIFASTVPALVLLYLPRALRYRLLGALCEPFLAEPLDTGYVSAAAELPTARYDDTADLMQQLESGNLSAGAMLRMANTAFTHERPKLVYRAVEAIWKQHPKSPEVLDALWVASQAQEREGDIAGMKATLTRLATLDPNHPLAGEARLKLRRL